MASSLDRAFHTFFPEDAYSPLELANAGHTQCTVIRLKKLGYKDGSVLQQSCSVITPNVSNHNTASGETLYSCVNVPKGKRLDIVRHSPYGTLMSILGPSRTVFTGGSVFSQSVFLNVEDVSSKFTAALDATLVHLQKRLCVRMYLYPGLAGPFVDVPAGYTVKLLRLLEFGSLIIPYGLKMTHANSVNSTAETTDLRGPMIVSHLHMESAFVGSMVDASLCAKPYVRDYTEAEHAAVDYTPFRKAGNLERVQRTTIVVSSDLYDKLQPLIGYYLLSKCLGEGTTGYMASTIPWPLDENKVTRLVFYWLKRYNGDYSIVTPFMKGRYEPLVRKALSLYCKRALQ